MRIVHIHLNASDAEGQRIADLCRMTDNSGHRALFCYADGTAPGEIASYRIGTPPAPKRCFSLPNTILRRAGREAHLLLSRITDRSGFYSRFATGRLLRQLEQYKPDLVHLHTLHGYYLHLPMLLQWLTKAKIPVVWTMRDCWAFTGHCLWPEDAEAAFLPEADQRRRRSSCPEYGCERYRSGCGHCPLKAAYPASLLRDQSGRNLAEKRQLIKGLKYLVITTPGEWLSSLLKRTFLSSFPSYTLPDIPTLSPCDDREYVESVLAYHHLPLEGKLLVASAGIWDEHSGLEDLIRLGELLGGKVTLAVTGLDEFQRTCPFPDGVVPLPPISQKDTEALLTAADLFVCPSHGEASALPLLDALACGCGVACYAVGEFAETVTPEIGEAASPREPEALAETIRHLLENPPKEENCKVAANRFTREQLLRSTMRLYENLYRHSPAWEEKAES